MKLIKLSDEKDLEKYKKDYEKIVLQFSANWCGPCRRITPKIEKFIENIEDDKIKYLYLDIEKFDKLADTLDIISIPSFTVYDKNSNEFSKIHTSGSINEFKKYLLDNDIILEIEDLKIEEEIQDEIKT